MLRLLQGERDGLSVARLDQVGNRQRSAPLMERLCAHRGRPAATKPAAAEPESRSAWRRVSGVVIDMGRPSLALIRTGMLLRSLSGRWSAQRVRACSVQTPAPTPIASVLVLLVARERTAH